MQKKLLKSAPLHKKLFEKTKDTRWHFCIRLTNGSLLRQSLAKDRGSHGTSVMGNRHGRSDLGQLTAASKGSYEQK